MQAVSAALPEYLEKGVVPSSVDIPTGLGKTAIMALWLIALAACAKLPRRLVYVVDRRAVVDQATEFAELLRTNLDSPEAAELKKALVVGDRSLPISTLRGQHVDNREWLEDPASAAIIVGTGDMIGSRLLFEGYGVSRKMRPYHAGLLGADTLVVLDEAHLVPPFEKLLEAIEQGLSQFVARDEADRKVISPFKLLSLSATGRERAGTVFRLEGSFSEPVGQRQDLDDSVVEQRLKAKKAVTIVAAKSEKLVFACLGFLEAADVLLGDAEGGFDWTGEANVRFRIRAFGNENPFGVVLKFLADSSVSALCPSRSRP